MSTSGIERLRDNLNQLGPLAPAGAVLLVGVYGSGFLVVCLHYASYGIAQFDLLRARVISAGVLFLVFLAVSATVALHAYGLYGSKGLQEKRELEAGASISSHILYNLSVKAVLFWDLFFLDVAVALFMGILLEDFEIDAWKIGYYVSSGITGVVLLLVVQRWFPKKPIWCGILALLALTLGLGVLIILKRWTDLSLVVWLLVSGRMVVYVVRQVRDVGEGFGPDLHLWVLGTIGVVSLFAVYIYPKVKPAIGGGAPVVIGMQFTDKSPLDGSSKSRFWLIDENDKGFYILRSKEDKKSVFLRRELISAIYYGD